MDTIYWFADFNDALDENRTNRIAAKLRQNQVKVIIHDFLPPLADAKKTGPVLKHLQDLADRTGGEFFLKPL